MISESLRTGLLVLVASLIGAAATTGSLICNLTTKILIGSEPEATVPFLNLWTLWWTADRAAHGFTGYWDAPIFHPNPGVLTYSEPQPLTGLLVAPLWAFGLAPVLIYNCAVLVLLVLNGIFAYRLARALKVPSLPAVVGVMIVVALPFLAKVAGELQLEAVFGMLWTLEGLVRFGRFGSARWAAWAGLGFVALFLTCEQYALMFAPFAVAAGLIALAQRHFRRRAVAHLFGAGIVAGAVVLAVAYPSLQIHARFGLSRPEQLVRRLSAEAADFLTRPETARAPIPRSETGAHAGLFPGVILLLLALIETLRSLRDPRRNVWTLFFAGSALLAGLLAVGLNLEILGWRPFATLRATIPGVVELRSPFRFVAITQLCLATLGTLGLCRLARSGARGSTVVMLIVALLAICENLTIPRLQIAPPRHAAWADWLRAQPAETVIAHVPLPEGLTTQDYEIETVRMLRQIDHHKPMVNGYSGYLPQVQKPDGEIVSTYGLFQKRMLTFPTTPLICVLNKRLGVTLLVADVPWLTAHQAQMDQHSDFLEPAFRDEEVQIYSLHVPDEACTRT